MTAADRTTEVDSVFGGGAVRIDPWAANALADDLAASNPWTFQQAVSEAPVPKMFANGTADIPIFTASGIDPNLLLQMPYGTRHYLAAASDRGEVMAAFERDSTNAYAMYGHDGLTAAIARLRTWATCPAWDPLAALREQQAQQAAAAAQQAAIDSAFKQGGAAASNALIATYRTQAATQAQAADAAYAAARNAMGGFPKR